MNLKKQFRDYFQFKTMWQLKEVYRLSLINSLQHYFSPSIFSGFIVERMKEKIKTSLKQSPKYFNVAREEVRKILLMTCLTAEKSFFEYVKRISEHKTRRNVRLIASQYDWQLGTFTRNYSDTYVMSKVTWAESLRN